MPIHQVTINNNNGQPTTQLADPGTGTDPGDGVDPDGPPVDRKQIQDKHLLLLQIHNFIIGQIA
jgi:hypothetical protein